MSEVDEMFVNMKAEWPRYAIEVLGSILDPTTWHPVAVVRAYDEGQLEKYRRRVCEVYPNASVRARELADDDHD